MRPIFISYRRDDTEGQAGRLFQDLREVFGTDNVFMDVVAIEPGVDFRRVIERNTESCGVLLALVGRHWLNATDENGHRRLDQPHDFVRLETAAALKRDIPVVPVLLQGARMPRQEELPDDLRDFAFRNSVELTHARWDSDVKILIAALRKVLSPQEPPSAETAKASSGSPHLRWWRPAVAAGVVVAVLGGWLALRDSPAPPVSTILAQRTNPGVEPPSPPIGGSGVAPSSAAGSTAASGAEASEDAARKEAAQKEAARAEATRKAAARQAELTKQAEEQRAAEVARQAGLAKQAEEQRAAEEAREAEDRRQAQVRAHNDGTCVTGFVWRDARPGDRVCTTPDIRTRTAAENRAAAMTRSPIGGPYGPDTCKQGYVWREAYPNDVVCVDPSSRQRAANDNAQAARRVVPLP